MSSAVERYPLAWPQGWQRTPSHQRQYPRFKAFKRDITRVAAVGRLSAELQRIKASHEVLSTNWELRIDGTPRLDRPQPGDPGVALYFKLKGRDRVLACDRFTTTEGNVAAIAAHIDALRRIDRYGVGTMEQAFAGYTALAAHASPWWEVLDFKTRPLSIDVVEARFTELAKVHHPDRGGNPDTMAKINAARDAARLDLS